MTDMEPEYQREFDGHTSSLVWRKIRCRMQFPLLLIIILSSIDRVNISFAALQMNADLRLTPGSFGAAASMFFVGYLLFQFPSAEIQRRIGTRWWITSTILLWGICATSMALVTDATTMYVLRFLLGVAESGLSPGIVYYSLSWMPRRFHAEAVAITLLAIPTSVILGGPLSGWLLNVPNPLGIAGWRWMFLMEGAPALLVAGMAYLTLSNTPEEAKWLTAPEKQWLRAAISRDNPTQPISNAKTLPPRVMTNPALWSCAVVWFACLLGANGIIFWLPQIVKQASGAGDFAVGAISAVPWLGIGVGMVLNAWHSDLTGERYRHLFAAVTLGGAGLYGATLAGTNLLSLGLLFVGGLGLGGAQSVFWSIPRYFWTGASLAAAITSINLIGNLASLISPWMIGALSQHFGSFQVPITVIAAVLTVSGLLVRVLRRSATAR